MIVFIKNAAMHGYHGVLEQERKVGNEFIISVSVVIPETDGMRSDRIQNTLSYVDLYRIVEEEMKTPRNLLETVALDIAGKIKRFYPEVISGNITIAKSAAPINGFSGQAGITYYF